MLQIVLGDDGRGIDLDRLRVKVVEKGLTTAPVVSRLSDSELLDFLFLPGFSTKDKVTEISGRGVGLDVVQSMVQAVRGSVRVSSQFGKGTRFILQLPLTVSVIRALLAEIAGEPFAFPLNRIDRILMLDRHDIRELEGKPHMLLDDQPVGLVEAAQVLDLPAPPRETAGFPSWSPAIAATASGSWLIGSWASATSALRPRSPAGQGSQPQQLVGARERLAGSDHRCRGPDSLDRQLAQRPPAQEAEYRGGRAGRSARSQASPGGGRFDHCP